MSDTMPICYPFLGASAENEYRLFPDHLENDEFVTFHGTAEAKLGAIIDNGFLFAGSLRSLSFAKTSALALGYALRPRTQDHPMGVCWPSASVSWTGRA